MLFPGVTYTMKSPYNSQKNMVGNIKDETAPKRTGERKRKRREKKDDDVVQDMENKVTLYL